MKTIVSSNLGSASEIQKYRFTNPMGCERMENLSGTVVTAVRWARVHEETEKGEKEILNMELEDGTMYGTVSPYFISDFDNFIGQCAVSDDQAIQFQVVARTSKAGRTCLRFDPIDLVDMGGDK